MLSLGQIIQIGHTLNDSRCINGYPAELVEYNGYMNIVKYKMMDGYNEVDINEWLTLPIWNIRYSSDEVDKSVEYLKECLCILKDGVSIRLTYFGNSVFSYITNPDTLLMDMEDIVTFCPKTYHLIDIDKIFINNKQISI